MARWADIAAAEPEFAERVQRVFAVHRHKTLATLRRDGSPRVSGIELNFDKGEVWMGMDPSSVKAADVRRDARVAVHATSEDPPEGAPSSWGGDAKISGRAVELRDYPSSYRLDIQEVVFTRVGDPADHLEIEAWHEGRGLSRYKR